MEVHRAEIRLSQVNMAQNLATDGLSPQPSKLFQEKRTASRLNTDRCQEREAVQWGSCSALPWHRSCALPRRCCCSGARGEDKPYLQPRNLKNLQKHHADGNLLLRIVPYLKLHTAHPAAEAAGYSSLLHGAGECSTTEILDASVLQRCGIIVVPY